MNTPQEPKVYEGSFALDDRGIVSFVNGFSFEGIKRFYLVENFSKDTIRAFHGHLKEKKYVLCIAGSAIIALVKMDDTKNPNKNNPVARFIVSSRNPSIVEIPPGYANGFKPLEQGTKILFFSTSTLEESKNDDYRFTPDYWGESVWKTENR